MNLAAKSFTIAALLTAGVVTPNRSSATPVPSRSRLVSMRSHSSARNAASSGAASSLCQPVYGGNQNVALSCSGTSSTSGGAIYSGGTFNADQYSEIVYTGSNSASGPTLRSDANGNFYLWSVHDQQIHLYQNGAFVSAFVGGCMYPNVGDTIRISAVGSTISCIDVTQNDPGKSGSDTTLTSGYPGFWLGAADATLGPFNAGHN